jgi:hypothetical protein
MKKLLVCIFSFVGITVHSQGLELAKLRTDIVPHSPEAEAIAKYGVLPVNLYTGMAQISVPIYEIKTPSLTLPFSFSYSNNGCKPNEKSSYVGMGWSVQGGGVITRAVRGLIDETAGTGRHYDDYASVSAMNWKQGFLIDVANGVNDAQPDLYIFNVGGYSGKFIMLKGKAYITPYQNIQIVPYSTGFKLTDDKGNQYLFTDYETTWHKNQGGGYIPQHKSAWYVSKIVSADRRDTVQFHYAAYTYKQFDAAMDSYTIDWHFAQSGNTNGHSFSHITFPADHIDALMLSSVVSNYGSILFFRSATRLDMTGSVGAKSLDSISVVGGIYSSLNKQIKLTHGYFGDSSRLRLKNIIIRDYSVTAGQLPDSNKYTFEYENENDPWPNSGSTAIDAWGYYNGAGNAMLFPAGSIPSPALYSFADRSAHESYSKQGILKKMTYPTGGYSTFEYEQNQKGHFNVSEVYTDSTINSGVVFYNSATAANGYNSSTKTFTLTTPQFVTMRFYNMMEDGTPDTFAIFNLYDDFYRPLYASPAMPSGITDGIDSILLQPGQYIFVVQCNQSLTSTYGSLEFRDYVIDNTLADAPGLRVKRICSFDGLNSADTALVKLYSYNEGVEFSHDYINSTDIYNTCSDFNISTLQAGSKSALSDLTDNQFFYTEATEVNRDSNTNGKTFYNFAIVDGLLTVKQTLQEEFKSVSRNNFLPVKKQTSEYTSVNRNQFFGYDVRKTQQVGPMCSICSSCVQITSPDITQPTSGLGEVYGPTNFTYFLSTYSLLSKTKETFFNDIGDSTLDNTINYFYDDSDHIWPTRIVTKDSKGLNVTTTLKYPLDYNFDTCATLTSLNDDFVNDQANAVTGLNSCLSSLISALAPYQPYSPNSGPNQTAFSNLVTTYNCQNKFKDTSTAVFARRDTAWSNYQNCLTSHIASNPTAWKKAVLWMKQNNIVSPVIEKYVSIKKADSTEYLLSATRNEYNIYNSQAVMPATISQVEAAGGLLKSNFLSNPDTYYKPQVNYGYDNKLNLAVQNQPNNVKQTYLWNYDHAYPVAQVVGADTNQIAYSSFEAESKGGWSYSGGINTDFTSPTGFQYYSLANGNITKSSLSSSLAYIVSYWKKDNSGTASVNSAGGTSIITKNGWTYYRHEISGSTTCTVSGSGSIDELRLYPKGAQMTTYTYDPQIGMIAQADPANRITYYEYDHWGRLALIRNHDKNVVKKIFYKYSNQPDDNNANYFSNVVKADSFTRNDCGAYSIGGTLLYSVAAGTYISTIGQTYVDSVAQADVDANGQAYANSHATCTCDVSGCSALGPDHKCINASCQTGTKRYISSVFSRGTGLWTCTYVYTFFDCSSSSSFTEINSSSCTVGFCH